MAEPESSENEAPEREPLPSVPSDVPDATEPSGPSEPSGPPEPSDATESSELSEPSEPPDQPLDLSRSALVQPEKAAAAAPAEEKPTVDEADAVLEEKEPVAGEAADESDALRRTVEALLFAAETPLTVREMARAASTRSNVVRKVLTKLKAALDTERRPWELVEVAGGWRLATRTEYFPAIQKLKVQRSQRRLTPAAMEVLALIAYSQEPIGRAEIEAVRGVDSGPVLRLLLERKLVRIAGRGQGLGQPLLYAVSQEFLEHFGLSSTKDLPQPGEFKG